MRSLFVVALASLLLLPAVSAHTTVSAADDRLCITVGHRSEPVATYYMSGLDLIVSEKLDPAGDCGSQNRGDEVSGFQNGLTEAVLVAPSGAERDQMPLAVQHGAQGRYTGAEAYILTEPGQYVLRLEGTWEGHDISGTYDVSADLDDSEPLMFPSLDEGANLAALQARIAQLESDVEALQAGNGQEASQDSPAPAAALLAIAFVAVAAVLRRRG